MSSHGRGALVDNGFWKTRIRVAFEASRPKPPPVEVAVQARPKKKQRRDAAVQTDPLPARVDVGVQTDPPPAFLSLGTQTAPPPPAAAAGVQTDPREGRGEAGVEARPQYAAAGAQALPRYVSCEVQAQAQAVPPGYASSQVQADESRGADDSLMAVDGHADAGEDDMLISPGSAASPLPDWKELHATSTSTPARASPPPPPSGPPPPPPPPPVEQKPSRWDIERSASSASRGTSSASTPRAPPAAVPLQTAATSDAKGPYSFAGFIPASARAKYKLARPTEPSHESSSSAKYQGLVEMWTVQQLDFPLTHPPPSHPVFQQTLRTHLSGRDLELALTAARRWFWAREKRPRLVAWHDKKEAAIAWERTQAAAEADFRSSTSVSNANAKKDRDRPPLAELPKLSLASAARTLALRPAFPRDQPASAEARVLLRLEEAERRLVAYGEPFDECRVLDGLRGAEYVAGRRAMHVRAWGALRVPGHSYAEMKEWAPERMDVELALWRSMRRTLAPLGGDGSCKREAEPLMDVVFFAPASLDADAPKRAGYPALQSEAYGRMVEQWTWDLLVRSTRNKDDGALQPLAPSDALGTIERLQDADLDKACGVLAAFVAAQIAPPHARADALALRPTLDAKRGTRAARVLAETARERLAGFVPSSFPQADEDEGADLSAFFVPRDVDRGRYALAVELWALLQDAILPAGTDVRRWLARMLDADDAGVARAALDVARTERYDGARSWVETKAVHVKREAERAEKARKDAEEKARKEAEEKARKEAEEKARKEAEERARKDAEEKARREAEEKARREAEEKARKEAEARAELERREKEALAEKARRQQEQEQARRQQEQEPARAAPATKVPGFVPAGAPLPAKPSFAPIALKPRPLDTGASRATTAVASLSPSTPHKAPAARNISPHPHPPSPSLPRRPATAVPGFVPASAPDGGALMRMGDRTTFVPRGDGAPAGPEYERALEEWVLDHIAREMLRMPDGGVPWPVELDNLVGYDRDVARRVWEEKCAMEGQPAAAAAYKRRRRAGRRVRRPSAASAGGGSHYSPSAGGSHYSPAAWDAHDRRGSGSWEDPERRWDDRDRAVASGWDNPPVASGWDVPAWDDPMAALERRSGWSAPPYDAPPPPPPPLQPPPPPPPPPGRDWERRGDVAWMPPAQVTPFDYEGRQRGRSPQPGTKRKRSRSSSAVSADSQFSYSQPVMSAVHTRVPLAHVVRRSRSRSRSRSPNRGRRRSSAANAENNYRPAEEQRWRPRSPSPGPAAGHYVPNDPRADHWEPSHEYDAPAPGPGPARRGGCFVCGEWGHEASRCPNRERAPHLVLAPGGRLTLPDGRTTVCWVWNSGAPCRARRRKSKGAAAAAPCGHAHACSLCGSAMHPACDCAQFQNRR